MSMQYADTKYGKIKGIKCNKTTKFFGVPYAKPPIGDLRWREPQEPECWDGVRDATRFEKRCIQRKPDEGEFYQKEFNADPDYLTEMSEDCLYLNLWTPADRPGKDYPVAMWIHGGGFTAGNGNEVEFDGEKYAENGVVFVTINYRLGVFGFFSHPWLKEEKGHSGNYGLLDQIQALKWIQENIEGFGGDPNRVTIMGQSAGAVSVQALAASELADGLFHRAIMQSGGGYRTGFAENVEELQAEKNGITIAEAAHIKSLKELRSVPAEKLYQLTNQIEARLLHAKNGLIFQPSTDGYVLKEKYDEAIKNAETADVDYLLGYTRNDLEIIPAKNNETSILEQGCCKWSVLNEQNGRRPSYVYCFERRLPGDHAGAFHSSELWYMFHTLKRCWRPMTEADEELADRMCTYWSNFIKTGDPNGYDLPEWKVYSRKNQYIQRLDVTDET